MKKSGKTAIAAGAALALAVFGVCDALSSSETKATSAKTAESSVTTNDNGSVARSFVEQTVTTNGNMVTERRRVTRTTMDTEGNVLETSTSEYAQSYSVGDEGMSPLASIANAGCGPKEEPVDADSFLGLKFGEEFKAADFVSDADSPTLLRAKFTPEKALAGFDDYYVYVTPKTHKIAKIYACAKDAVEPGAVWRRHYLVEALEKRYHAWARLCSYRRPYYRFDLGGGRYVDACLSGATQDYETILAAWDEDVLRLAGDEQEAIREEARKNAKETRKRRVSEAADAF